jgi:hypothetical protein
MSDDYLWDGSGEPDPEIESLERLLANYRYQPKPVEIPARPRRLFKVWVVAAAAAIVLMVLAGVLAAGMWSKDKGQDDHYIAGTENNETTETPDNPPAPTPEKNTTLSVNPPPINKLAVNKRDGRKALPEPAFEEFDWDIEQGVEESSFTDETSFIAMSLPPDESFTDVETAQHIEKAQLLLRAFRNAMTGGKTKAFDIEYEREKSRELVYRNIVLRRDAEARNNYPVEELLASLEPLLLDIANLPASPSREEMRSIVDRMQKMEIVATLQVHSGLLAIQNQ